jgi:hypothetical protein
MAALSLRNTQPLYSDVVQNIAFLGTLTLTEQQERPPLLGYHLYSPLRANKLLRRCLYGRRSSSSVTAGTRTHGYCSKILPLLVGSGAQERTRFELAYPGRYS